MLPACSSSDDDDDSSNLAPSVSAGEDQTVNQGATVNLTGAASDSDGSISSWLWQLTSDYSDITIENSTNSNAYFTAPTVDNDTTLTFELTVKDNDGASVSDSMRVIVRGPDTSINPLPDNLEAEPGNGQVTLTWSHHSDATTYNIYRSSDYNCQLANYTSCADSALLTSKSSPFNDTGLTNSITYYYWIEAILDGVTYLSNGAKSATPAVDEDDDIDLSNGLVAHYEFEGDASDSSGNGNDGEIIGATLTENRFGEEDGAYHIAADSSYDRISLPAETVNGLEDFTIASWVRFDAKNINHTTILSVSNSEYNNELYLGYSSTWGVWFVIMSGSEETFSDATEFPINKWFHVVYTKQGSSSSIYLDGTLINTLTVADYVVMADTDGVIIGQDQDSVGGTFDSTQSLNGDIDSFRIYDRALSSAEIQALYELDDKLADGLVARYEFEGDADDSSGNNYNGEVIGATLTSDRFGEEDGAYYIAADSSYDRISLPTETINGLEDFTIASWVRFDAKNINHTTILSVSNSEYNNELYLGYSSTWGVWFIIMSGSEETFSDATEFPINKWFHVVYTKQGSSSSIYLDGTLINTLTVADYVVMADTGGVIIGQDQDSVGGTFDSTQSLNGDIDSFRIYNRALSAEEVQTLYELGDD